MKIYFQKGVSMKKLLITVVLAVAMAACGSSGGGGGGDCSNGEAAAESAFGDFDTIMENDDVMPCLGFERTTCDCPNGGTVTSDAGNMTWTFDDCTSAADQIYTGTFTLSQDMTTIDANMTKFDGCTNFIATDVITEPGSCSGTLSATCGGQNLTCTMTEGEGECIPGNCTC